MKVASYKDAIDWIAHNDGAGDDEALDVDSVSYLVTSVLIADIFGVTPERVGKNVVERRGNCVQYWHA